MDRRIALLVVSACIACGTDSTDDDKGGASSGGQSPGFGANADGGVGAGGRCNPNLTGLVRDFRGKVENGKDVPNGHPDFETYEAGRAKGLVARELGPDRKPVFASTTGSIQERQLTGKAEFDQWYRNVDGVNQAFEFVLALQPAGGVQSYSNDFFFPTDAKGFGLSGIDRSETARNFHFTFELHLEFVYRGGETFTFTGDDDLWVFFNGKLGIDIGGVHGAISDTVKLDEKAAEFGVVKGATYPLDVFHAERHTRSSRFRVDTTLEFTNCDKIILVK